MRKIPKTLAAQKNEINRLLNTPFKKLSKADQKMIKDGMARALVEILNERK